MRGWVVPPLASDPSMAQSLREGPQSLPSQRTMSMPDYQGMKSWNDGTHYKETQVFDIGRSQISQ
ncbi:MAG: hypothetical protein KC545_16315 [Nitrospira sp.]|nr:hypothetical protein [Nitrospira sp.]